MNTQRPFLSGWVANIRGNRSKCISGLTASLQNSPSLVYCYQTSRYAPRTRKLCLFGYARTWQAWKPPEMSPERSLSLLRLCTRYSCPTEEPFLSRSDLFILKSPFLSSATYDFSFSASANIKWHSAETLRYWSLITPPPPPMGTVSNKIYVLQ